MLGHIRREPYINSLGQCICGKKNSLLFFDDELLKCSRCERRLYKEIGISCRFCKLEICEKCLEKYSEVQEESKTLKSKAKCSFTCKVLGLLVLLGAIVLYKTLNSEISVPVLTPDNLRSYFPSQSQETWYHILSTLDMSISTVKSLTLLHGKDENTTECLVSKLIVLYTKNSNIQTQDISFKNVSHEVKDYGEVLEYYRPIVEKYRIFVTDLNKIPGNIARIFHSLCDEGSSPIKPSLFIFILRYDENAKHLKPLTRATTILKEAWQDLPSNELFPLLSRVVKNVIDVIPEKQIKC